MKLFKTEIDLKIVPIVDSYRKLNWRGEWVDTDVETTYAILIVRKHKFGFIPLPTTRFYVRFNTYGNYNEPFAFLQNQYLNGNEIDLTLYGEGLDTSEILCTQFSTKYEAEYMVNAMKEKPEQFII